MPPPILDSTFFYSTPETFPATIADNKPVQHSLTPRHHVKHPKWYFDDADLFFTQRGVLFGLHRHKFNNPHFSRRLNHIEPCRTAAIGTVSSLPISLNALSISIVHSNVFRSFFKLFFILFFMKNERRNKLENESKNKNF